MAWCSVKAQGQLYLYMMYYFYSVLYWWSKLIFVEKKFGSYQSNRTAAEIRLYQSGKKVS